jgi:hypothetical protein
MAGQNLPQPKKDEALKSGDGLDPRGPHGDDAANAPGDRTVATPAKGRPAGKKPGPRNPA